MISAVKRTCTSSTHSDNYIQVNIQASCIGTKLSGFILL